MLIGILHVVSIIILLVGLGVSIVLIVMGAHLMMKHPYPVHLLPIVCGLALSLAMVGMFLILVGV